MITSREYIINVENDSDLIMPFRELLLALGSSRISVVNCQCCGVKILFHNHCIRCPEPNPERSEDARDGRSAESRCSTAEVSP